MTVYVDKTERYLGETLHTPADLAPWGRAAELPGYLRQRYHFFEGALGETSVLFLFTAEEITPRTAQKHTHALRKYWTGPLAFVFDTITARRRQRLVSEGVAFVVPGRQVYLPMLGTNFTERYKERVDAERLRPSAQMLLLHMLSVQKDNANTPTTAARLLGYTAMAMGQALDQLEAAGLVGTQKVGRERVFHLTGGSAEVWERAQPVLVSPVRRQYLVAGPLPRANRMLAAGLSALAEYSALAAPHVPEVAVSSTRARELRAHIDAAQATAPEEADHKIEIWSYAPERLAHDGSTVDRLSLYLALREDPDERVQSALEEMMRDLPW